MHSSLGEPGIAEANRTRRFNKERSSPVSTRRYVCRNCTRRQRTSLWVPPRFSVQKTESNAHRLIRKISSKNWFKDMLDERGPNQEEVRLGWRAIPTALRRLHSHSSKNGGNPALRIHVERNPPCALASSVAPFSNPFSISRFASRRWSARDRRQTPRPIPRSDGLARAHCPPAPDWRRSLWVIKTSLVTRRLFLPTILSRENLGRSGMKRAIKTIRSLT